MYTNTAFIHKMSHKKNIAEGVNKRLSENSSNEEIFNAAAPVYQESLKESGYNYELKFEPPSNESKEKKRQGTRNTTWCNPPYSDNVTDSVATQFLKFLDKYFDKKNPLHKILNRSTEKVSYRTTPNRKQIISGHNTKIQTHKQTPTLDTKLCNCRSKKDCLLEGKCFESSVIYQVTVTETSSKKSEM